MANVDWNKGIQSLWNKGFNISVEIELELELNFDHFSYVFLNQ